MPTRPSKSNTFVIQSDMPAVEHCAIPMRLPTRLHRYGHLVPCSGNGVMIDVSRPTRTVLAALSFDRYSTPTATLCNSFSAPAALYLAIATSMQRKCLLVQVPRSHSRCLARSGGDSRPAWEAVKTYRKHLALRFVARHRAWPSQLLRHANRPCV